MQKGRLLSYLVHSKKSGLTGQSLLGSRLGGAERVGPSFTENLVHSSEPTKNDRQGLVQIPVFKIRLHEKDAVAVMKPSSSAMLLKPKCSSSFSTTTG